MEEPLQTIKGIGPGREKQFHKLGIYSVTGLLTYFPRTYEDRTVLYTIHELRAGMLAGTVGIVVKVNEKRPRRGLSILEVYLSEGYERGFSLKLVFFNQGYKKNFYKPGMKLYVYGKVEVAYGSIQINTPYVETIYGDALPDKGIVPIYPLVEGVSQYIIRQAIKNWFDAHHEMEELLPLEIRNKHHFMSRYQAFKEMHYPKSLESYQAARQQLAFEELFVMQTGLLLLREHMSGEVGIKLAPNGKLIDSFMKQLPFALTGDQRRAFQEICFDMEGDVPMQRLLQGDVGSGKTVVGTLALLKAIENGYQGAMMAPTEILAVQHYTNICKLCEGLPVKVALLVGSTKIKDRDVILEALRKGDIQILVGTHALIQEHVVFKKLALAIIDEQHRFGVRQRATLQQKGDNPHFLLMTATPIPRTMALSVYGDLELSIIKELPPGRQPVNTYVVNSSYKSRLLTFFEKEMAAGRQVYVVCPLVEESESLDLKAAEELYLELTNYFAPRFSVGLVHGRMSGKDKEAVMSGFYKAEFQLLVSTTVIEVGVDVPNATIMCITGAERFGLSQLHQLRGRVGRGQFKSYCILVSDSKNEDSRVRLKLMEKIQDGFELAEQDLLLRGAGQFFGYTQSGLPDLRVANIVKDVELLVEARQDSKDYIAQMGVDKIYEEMKDELLYRFGQNFVQILYS